MPAGSAGPVAQVVSIIIIKCEKFDELADFTKTKYVVSMYSRRQSRRSASSYCCNGNVIRLCTMKSHIASAVYTAWSCASTACSQQLSFGNITSSSCETSSPSDDKAKITALRATSTIQFWWKSTTNTWYISTLNLHKSTRMSFRESRLMTGMNGQTRKQYARTRWIWMLQNTSIKSIKTHELECWKLEHEPNRQTLANRVRFANR